MFKVSVLIPVYKVEDYIEKCARSLFSNTIASDCEFIFTNDCTPDSSMKILERVVKDFPGLKDNIKILNHKTNMGIGATRNTGFNKATGEYVICTDSDDYVEPDYLEVLYEEAKKGNYDVVSCDFFVEDENGEKFQNDKNDIFYNNYDKNLEAFLNRKITSFLWNKLIKRNFLQAHNIFWDNNVTMLDDMLFLTKVFCNKPSAVYVSKNLYHYLKRKGSYCHSVATCKTADSVELALSQMYECLNKKEVSVFCDSFYKLVCWRKYDLLQRGTNVAQKKALKMLYKANSYVDKENIKSFYYDIIKISTFSCSLAYCLLHFFFLSKCLLRRINYRDYIEKV